MKQKKLENKAISVCLACSAGGHLSEMLQLQPFYKKFDHFFVTFKRSDTDWLKKKERVFFIERPARNPLNALQSFLKAVQILRQQKPDLVISTGADTGLMVCLAGKLLGKQVVFIESFCRPYSPSVSGRIAYWFADLFIYQWKSLQSYYPKGVFGGSIF